jgi:hypothetical protein
MEIARGRRSCREATLTKDPRLVPFWIRFEGEPELKHSYGVTAYSLDDALTLLKNQLRVGQDVERPIGVSANVRIEDLDPSRVVPKCGPMAFRGVWYPWSSRDDESS